MAKITFTTAFNRNNKSIRDVSVKEFTAPNKVKKSLAYAVDINEIYKNYCQSGKLPLNGQQPIYDENFVKYDSLIEAQKIIAQASDYFLGLPANIKNQYGNSLEKFIYALNNKDEFLVKEGLLNLPTPEEVIKEDNITTQTPIETTITDHVNTATTD